MEAALLWGIVCFVLYFVLDYLSSKYLRNDLLSSFPLIVYFIFIYANIDASVAPFYLFMAILVLVFSVVKFGMVRATERQREGQILPMKETEMKVLTLDGKGKQIKGLGFYAFNMVLGLVIFLGMRLILSGVASDKLQAYMGVPLLSLVALKANLSIVSVMSLAIIENKFMIVVKEFFGLLKNTLAKALTGIGAALFGWIPFLNVILVPFMMFLGTFLVLLGPILLTAIVFAVFHLAAFNLVLGSLLFAGSIMVVWLIVYQVTRNDVAMNVAHMLWNGAIQFYRLINGG